MLYTLEQEKKWKETISQAARAQGMFAPEVIEKSGELYEKYFFEYFRKYIQKDNSLISVLDVGCGVGKISKKLQSLGFQVHGADFSEEIISLARQHAPQVNFQVASAYTLPFSSDMFDIVICLGLFQTVGDMEGGLQEISRVLKPQGILIVRTPNSLSLGYLFLPKTIHFSNPYAFVALLSRFSFKTTALKGVYVFPPFLRWAGAMILKTKLFRLFNLFFFLSCFFSHSFYIEAKKTPL